MNSGRLALLFAMHLAGSAAAAQSPATQLAADAAAGWHLIYVMSYDNNLEHCADPILAQLQPAAGHAAVRVSVLVDRTDADGLQVYTLSRGQAVSTRVESDDITDPAALVRFLDAATASDAPATRYAVVFLNHGGRLDEMCQDSHVGDAPEARLRDGWMSAAATGEVLRNWRTGESGDRRFELLFLQQCGRGSVENLYAFHGTAELVLSSQTVVGACNTYYVETVAALNGETGGRKLADLIMDKDEHYTDYVLCDGKRLTELPEKITSLCAGLDAAAGSAAIASLRPCFQVMGERNFDLLQVVEALHKDVDASKRSSADAFAGWVRNDLVLRHARRDPARTRKWCGLSIFVPANADQLARYAKLPAYLHAEWRALAERLMAR